MDFSINLIKTVSNLEDKTKLDIWYNRYVKLIEYAKTQNFGKLTHGHHILPRSMFPEFKDTKENIVVLSYRLHYLAHFILLKLTVDSRMAVAFTYMNRSTNKAGFYLNSRLFAATTEEITKSFVENPEICTPSKLYWTLDENGNRCRTEDPSKKISGVAPWQKGFDSINKERTKFFNMLTKNFEYIDKNVKPELYHYRIGAYKKGKLFVYLYKGMYYFKFSDLPRELHFGLKHSDKIMDNIIPTTDSYLYKHSVKLDLIRKEIIELHGGKTLGEIGLKVYNIEDPNFKFDLSIPIFNFEEKNRHT